MSDKDRQQRLLHPLVNAVHLAATSMADMGIGVQFNLVMAVLEDLPEDLADLEWVKNVQAACGQMEQMNDQTEVLKALFQEGRGEDILPQGYLI